LKINNDSNFSGVMEQFQFDAIVNVDSYPAEILKSFLYELLYLRLVEEFVGNQRKHGNIRGPVHLGVGQEAISVAISRSVLKTDAVFGAHRSHSHILSLGTDLVAFFSELLCKPNGCSGGMGGSMHLWDQSVGFYGSVPIVSGTVPIAVGAALSMKINKESSVAISYLGDGAVEEGVVHESLNLAKIFNLPVIFVVENNFFASHMHIDLRQSSSITSRFAISNNIPFASLDGNNITLIYETSKSLIESARNGGGPAFIEAFTFRHYGHVDWRTDVDVGVHRSEEDIKEWMSRDPISRLSTSMIGSRKISEHEVLAMREVIQQKISEAWKAAELAPSFTSNPMLETIYQ